MEVMDKEGQPQLHNFMHHIWALQDITDKDAEL